MKHPQECKNLPEESSSGGDLRSGDTRQNAIGGIGSSSGDRPIYGCTIFVGP